MVNTIKINFDTVELLVYFWESVKDRSKIADSFFIELADKAEMQPLYGKEFSKESVRKVLSAIANRERVNNATPPEARFWSNNMWMIEDMKNMNTMLKVVKTLNMDYFKSSLPKSGPENVQLIFIPGHDIASYMKENKLYINFFKLIANQDKPEEMNIEGTTFKTYIEKKLTELTRS